MSRKIYLYGAGNLGKTILSQYQKLGIEVAGIVDEKKIGERIGNFQIIGFSDLEPDSEIHICVLNNWVAIERICSRAADHGVTNVLTPPKVFFKLGELGCNLDWYWLTTNFTEIESQWSEITNFYSDKFDDTSKNLLLRIKEYRLGGKSCDELALPESLQYLETGMKNFWSGDVHFLDAGAYTGDTIKSLILSGVNIANVYAFEPDLENFKKLSEFMEFENLNGVCFKAAIGNNNSMVNFESTGSSGSSVTKEITENSHLVLQLRADEVLFKTITHIKMDIEGFELAALMGMERILKHCKPNLAISVYHKPEDLIAIGRFIDSLGIYKNWSLRCFANQSFETILFVTK